MHYFFLLPLEDSNSFYLTQVRVLYTGSNCTKIDQQLEEIKKELLQEIKAIKTGENCLKGKGQFVYSIKFSLNVIFFISAFSIIRT